MEKYMSIFGVLIAIIVVFFFVFSYYMSGKAGADPSFGSCDQIEDLGARTLCLKDLALKNADVTPCLQIERTFDRDICLRNVALKSRDSTMCEQIVTADIKRICRNDLG
ncbi:MAG: hypothetical protein ABIF01_03325 [Candidatus Micrarchaeota archaeon]